MNGGRDAKPGKWPWIVLVLSQYDHSVGRCAGTVIDANTILTAAHCTTYLNESSYRVEKAREIYVVAGRHTVSSPEPDEQKRISVKSLTSSYSVYKLGLNDIALLKLNEPLKFTARVRPICLPKQGKELKERTKATLIGWGSDYRPEPIDILQELKLRVVPERACLRDFPEFVNHKLVCTEFRAGRGGLGACKGDSGGPLMTEEGGRWYQYGVVSIGPLCNLSIGDVTFFTKVPAYRKWIDSNSKPKSMRLGASESSCPDGDGGDLDD